MADSRKFMNNNQSFVDEQQGLLDLGSYYIKQAKITCRKLSNLQKNLTSEIDCLMAKGARIPLMKDEEKYLSELQFNVTYSQYLEKQLQIAINKLKNNFVLLVHSIDQLQLALKDFITENNHIDAKMHALLNSLEVKGAGIKFLLSDHEVSPQITSTNNIPSTVDAMVHEFKVSQVEESSAKVTAETSTTTNNLAKVNQRIQAQFRLLGLPQSQPSSNSQQPLANAQPPTDTSQQRINRARQMHELIKQMGQAGNCRSRM